MLRLSATLLESARLFEKNIIQSDALIASIKKESEETLPMLIGSAGHAIFEDREIFREWYDGVDIFCCDGITFDADTFEHHLKDIWHLNPVFEVKTEDLILQTDYGPVRIVCMADAMVGSDVWELKFSRKSLVMERYADSMQWRCYCLAYAASKFNYRVCQLKHFPQDDIFKIIKAETLTVYPYPGITQDIVNVCHNLLHFMDINNLNDYRLEAAA